MDKARSTAGMQCIRPGQGSCRCPDSWGIRHLFKGAREERVLGNAGTYWRDSALESRREVTSTIEITRS